MPLLVRSVDAAVERWVVKGLVSETTAGQLLKEVAQERRDRARRLGQLLVAGLGAFALVAAAVLFAERSWENLTEAVRTMVLVGAGGVGYGIGLVVRGRMSLDYSGALLQLAGLVLLLVGLMYSANAWEPGTGGAILVGVAGLLIPVLLAPVSFRQGELTTGIHAALVFPYWATGLALITDWGVDEIPLVLDGLLALGVVGLFWAIRRWPSDHRDRLLVALLVTLWAGIFLALFTGLGPMELGDDSIYLVDLWALCMAGLTIWGIHRAPDDYRRGWYPLHLAAVTLLLGGLAMGTAAETWDLEAAGAWGGSGLVGGLGLVYGLASGSPAVLVASAGVVLFGTWIYAVDSAGALGGVLALLLSAVVLFWMSTRIRERKGARPSSPAEDSGSASG